jgi:hypothetical protein
VYHNILIFVSVLTSFIGCWAFSQDLGKHKNWKNECPLHLSPAKKGSSLDCEE